MSNDTLSKLSLLKIAQNHFAKIIFTYVVSSEIQLILKPILT
jgi:hypothetical protein